MKSLALGLLIVAALHIERALETQQLAYAGISLLAALLAGSLLRLAMVRT